LFRKIVFQTVGDGFKFFHFFPIQSSRRLYMIKWYKLEVKPAKWSFLETYIDKPTFINNKTGIALTLAEPAIFHSFPFLQRFLHKLYAGTMVEILS
jgi:hypothetical protein